MYYYAITDTGWRGYGDIGEGDPLAENETLVEEVPQWLIDKVAAAAVLAAATADLNARTREGNAQALALNGRIATLNWLIDEQDPDDPDYIEPTEEDIAERAVLKPLLTKWNSYNVKLGKVKTQATWPTAPVWPVAPALYVEGPSSTAPETA